MQLLGDLIRRTYWYPRPGVDSEFLLAVFNSKGGASYLRNLERMAVQYLQRLNSLCKKDNGIAKVLDKPNVHRLLELYKHSIPAAGHVKHFTELLFESAHQPLKRAMSQSNHINCHIQAIHHAIFDDFKRRLSTEICNDDGYLSMRNLLCGMTGNAIPVTSDLRIDDREQNSHHNECWELVLHAIKPSSNLHTEGYDGERWEPYSPIQSSEEMKRSYVSLYKLWAPEITDREPAMFGKARFIRSGDGNTHRSKEYSRIHDYLVVGDVVQTLLSQSEPCHTGLMRSFNTSEFANYDKYSSALLVIHAFLQETEERKSRSSYAIVQYCSTFENRILVLDPSSSPGLLSLTSAVRRVGVVHCCTADGNIQMCLVGDPYGQHKSVLNGGKYYFFTRDKGYPPRMS